jgi:hypothetical protein
MFFLVFFGYMLMCLTFSGLDSVRRLMKEEMWALMYFSGHFRVFLDLSFTLYEILKECLLVRHKQTISEKGIRKHKSTSEIKFCEANI